jgi:hypothetical protein
MTWIERLEGYLRRRWERWFGNSDALPPSKEITLEPGEAERERDKNRPTFTPKPPKD